MVIIEYEARFIKVVYTIYIAHLCKHDKQEFLVVHTIHLPCLPNPEPGDTAFITDIALIFSIYYHDYALLFKTTSNLRPNFSC